MILKYFISITYIFYFIQFLEFLFNGKQRGSITRAKRFRHSFTKFC